MRTFDSTVLKFVAVAALIGSFYYLCTSQWSLLMTAAAIFLFTVIIGLSLDRASEYITTPAYEKEIDYHKWDSVIEGANYDLVRRDMSGLLKEMEKRGPGSSGGRIYTEKEVPDHVRAFIDNPCRRTADELLDAAPYLKEYFLKSKKK